MQKNDKKILVPGGVDEYIASCPTEAQNKLEQIRAVIQKTAPKSIETVSYFQIPGYSYPGYDYNGMFAWFSFKQPYVRLHIRPPVIHDHAKELAGFETTASIISFPLQEELPEVLIQKMVTASLDIMRAKDIVKT
ncbi:MAG TPA: DUF1801 domain-containing protein [Candidatus Saccharimonadales bacterium]|nr:DUF1801 domain-containing protein [Candidatus Saccharimonadales bacterium]